MRLKLKKRQFPVDETVGKGVAWQPPWPWILLPATLLVNMTRATSSGKVERGVYEWSQVCIFGNTTLMNRTVILMYTSIVQDGIMIR